MSKRSRKTLETEPEKTTEASAVELAEGELDEVAGGWDFKNAWPVQNSRELNQSAMLADTASAEVFKRTT